MEGFKMEQAKKALVELLKLLSDKCKFNIFSFGDDYKMMFS